MLQLYTLSRFQEWYVATNGFHKAAYLETGEPEKEFVPFSVSASPTSHYYLYNDAQVGLCGSVELARLQTEQSVDHLFLPVGTWIIKNSSFFLCENHPFSSVSERYEPLIQGFYQKIFAQTCLLSVQDNLSFALTYHQQTHNDFVNFGNFTLIKEWRNKDWIENKSAIVGILSLKDQPRDTAISFTQSRKKQNSDINNIWLLPLSSISRRGGLTSLSSG